MPPRRLSALVFALTFAACGAQSSEIGSTAEAPSSETVETYTAYAFDTEYTVCQAESCGSDVLNERQFATALSRQLETIWTDSLCGAGTVCRNQIVEQLCPHLRSALVRWSEVGYGIGSFRLTIHWNQAEQCVDFMEGGPVTIEPDECGELIDAGRMCVAYGSDAVYRIGERVAYAEIRTPHHGDSRVLLCSVPSERFDDTEAMVSAVAVRVEELVDHGDEDRARGLVRLMTGDSELDDPVQWFRRNVELLEWENCLISHTNLEGSSE